MAITYNWVVNSMNTITTTTGEQDYVVQANYSVIASETQKGVDYTSQIDNSAFFSQDSQSPSFVPYDQLTNDMVVGWIKEQLGVDGVANVESTLADQIANLINPPVTPQPTPLPWS